MKVQIRKSIQTLAAAAKEAFRKRMEPSIPNLSLVNLAPVNRDLFSVLRDYARNSFDAAIDALAAEATNPQRALAVEHALRIFVEAGQTSGTDASFAEMVQRKTSDARAAAATLRHSVALVELPAALAKLIKPPYESLPLPPDGEKALPAYRHAAALDPNDAWTWIILALLEDEKSISEAAFRNAERSAAAVDDWRAGAFSKQLFGAVILESRGQAAEAERVYLAAVALARQKSAANPSDAASQRELARDLVWFGAMKAKRGDAASARAAYEEALGIRKALEASYPDSIQGNVDLIASYSHLWPLLFKQGLKEEGKKYFNEAGRIYDVATRRSGLVPTFINQVSSS